MRSSGAVQSVLPDQFARIGRREDVVAHPTRVQVGRHVEVADPAGLAHHHLLLVLREDDERTQVALDDVVDQVVYVDRRDEIAVDDGLSAHGAHDRPPPFALTPARVAPVRAEAGEEPERPERTDAERVLSELRDTHGVDHLDAFTDDEGIPRVDSVSASANGRCRVVRGNGGEREAWRTDAGDGMADIDVLAHGEAPG